MERELELFDDRLVTLSCRVVIKRSQPESTEVPAETWRETGGKIILKKKMNGSVLGGHVGEAKPEARDVGVRDCADRGCTCGVPVVIVGCLSEADAVEGVVDSLL